MGQPADADLQTGRQHLSGDQSAEQVSNLRHAVEMGVLAALGHHKPNYRSVRSLGKSASIITDFVVHAIGELCPNDRAKAEGRDR